MTLETFFRSTFYLVAVYLGFKVGTYAVTGTGVVILATITLVFMALIVMGTPLIVKGPDYPSTVRARLQQGFKNGASRRP